MAHIDDSLKAALYRITCPDSATLGNFHLGLLSSDKAETIVAHVGLCPHCTAELNQLELFLAETAVSPEPTISQRIKVWIAKRMLTYETGNDPMGTPAFALRGDEIEPLMYEAGDAQLSLEVQDDPEHPGRKSILGLVLGIETEAVNVQLMQAEDIVTAVVLDTLGNFTLSNLQTGEYALMLTGPDVEIYVQSVEI